jgi:hypothetical protein
LGLWPGATPFDLSDGVASPALDEIVQGPAAALTAVALVAGPRARASGWAGRAAVAIAERWRGGRAPVLLDLDLDRPSLHATAGLANEEGVADLIGFGLSLAAVTQEASGFGLVAAGVYAPDPGAVLRSDAWTRVLLEAAAGRHTLLAWVPSLAEGMNAIVQRAGAVIVLAEHDEAEDVVQRLPHPFAVLAVLIPAPEREEPPVPAAAAADVIADAGPPPTGRDAAAFEAGSRLSDEEFEQIRLPTDRESRESLIADLRERQRAARMAPPPASHAGGVGGPPAASTDSGPAHEVLMPAATSEAGREMRLETAADDARLDAIDPGPPAPRRSRYRRPLAWTVVLVLMLSVLAGAWRYLAGRIGWAGTQDLTDPAASADGAVTPPQQAIPAVEEVALPWVVAIEAHTDLARAGNRITALRNAALELPFHIAPLERENTLYYHVMAGPVQDSGRALALRDTLLVRQLKTAATPNDVRYAPLAFLIGDYGTRAVAELQIEELQRLDIPSYLLLADADDGYPLYRVYVGGYAAAGEAEVGRMLLRAAGVRDSLVTRTGSIVP